MRQHWLAALCMLAGLVAVGMLLIVLEREDPQRRVLLSRSDARAMKRRGDMPRGFGPPRLTVCLNCRSSNHGTCEADACECRCEHTHRPRFFSPERAVERGGAL